MIDIPKNDVRPNKADFEKKVDEACNKWAVRARAALEKAGGTE